MKIAVTATAPTLDAGIDPRFGRSAYFLIVDSDTLQLKAIQNPNIMATGGAGIQSAQLVVAEGAQAVISGSFGPNAVRTLTAAGVQLYEGFSGTVREAIEKFKAGQLTPAAAVAAGYPQGMGYGANPGFGYGGFGRGMGRGRGGRGGYGWGMVPPAPGTFPATPPAQSTVPPQPMSANATVEMLKEQAKQLAEQLKQINQKIRELEGK